MPSKARIDALLHQRSLAPTLAEAQALIMAGKVLVNEQKVRVASETYPTDAVIRIKGAEHPYVSRGGVKLAGALDHFSIDPRDKTCLDVGASTGGFTDCLLQRGARRVYTLDCGTNQLDYRIRSHPRVVARENFNIRELRPEDLAEPVDLVCVDVSFISLRLVIPPLFRALPPPCDWVLLIKPQFEAERHEIASGGLIADEEIRGQIVKKMIDFTETAGLRVLATTASCLQGDRGNQEYFLWAKT